MTRKEITRLPLVTTLFDTDEFPVVNANILRKTRLSQIANFINNLTGGNETGVVVQRIGATKTEGYEIVVIDKIIQCNVAPAASFPVITFPLSPRIILCFQVNLQDTISAVTADRVGLGMNGDESIYGKTSGLSKNLKINSGLNAGGQIFLEGGEQINLFAVDAFGAPTGTIGGAMSTNERIRVRIVWAQLNSLDDAI